MKTMINNTVEVNMSCFVIPNRARLAKGFTIESFRNHELTNAMMLCAVNNVPYDAEKTKLAEIWFTAVEDLGSENLRDHGFKVDDLYGQEWHTRMPSAFVPVTIFEGHKEGDVIDITYPMIVTSWDMIEGKKVEKHTNLTMKIHLAMEQTKYRYRSFGNFEDVLVEVCKEPKQ